MTADAVAPALVITAFSALAVAFTSILVSRVAAWQAVEQERWKFKADTYARLVAALAETTELLTSLNDLRAVDDSSAKKELQKALDERLRAAGTDLLRAQAVASLWLRPDVSHALDSAHLQMKQARMQSQVGGAVEVLKEAKRALASATQSDLRLDVPWWKRF